MKQGEVEENIEHYLPSQDEIILAEDTLNLINLVCNCNAHWKDLKEMYARLSYGCVAMAVWQEDGEEYYTHAWTEIQGSEVKVSVGVNILEVATRQVFRYEKPFEHGKLVAGTVDFESLRRDEQKKEEETVPEFYERDMQEAEEDDFDKRLNAALLYGEPDTEEEEEPEEETQSKVEEAPDRFAEYLEDLQYAKSFKEQFGTDSTEMNEETASTKFYFGVLRDFFGL